MRQASFDHFVHVLRMVYMGRSQTARPYLADLSREEREDWYRLADTFRSLIDDSGCLEWSRAHDPDCQSAPVSSCAAAIGD